MKLFSDEYFMKIALEEAKYAYHIGEVPVGAIVVCNNQVIAKAHNNTELLKDVTAHAEIMAMTSASNYLQSKYLTDCTLYVTLEPCIMCAGAMKWAQLGRLVYAAADEKQGFMKIGVSILHPKTKVAYGTMEEQSSKLVTAFFRAKRNLSI